MPRLSIARDVMRDIAPSGWTPASSGESAERARPVSFRPARAPRALAALLSLALAFVLGGAGHAAGELEERSIDVGGVERHYAVHRPSGFDPTHRYPAVIVLHGGGGSGEAVAEQSRMATYADEHGFVAVFPDAVDRQWNDGRATAASFGDDVTFLLTLIDELAAEDAVDSGRVFVAGLSNGGMMAQRLACEAPERFSAFASVVANLPADLEPECAPGQPVAIVLFAGTEDRVMPWDGGEIRLTRRRGLGGEVISAPATAAFWADVNGCEDEEVESLPDSADDGAQVKRHVYTGCSEGGALVFYEMVGGGHGWPGAGTEGRSRLLSRLAGGTVQDIDATAEIVAFFQAHGL